jgi:hypothetical protein
VPAPFDGATPLAAMRVSEPHLVIHYARTCKTESICINGQHSCGSLLVHATEINDNPTSTTQTHTLMQQPPPRVHLAMPLLAARPSPPWEVFLTSGGGVPRRPAVDLSTLATRAMAEVAQDYVVGPVTKFSVDSLHLWRKCTKPDSKGK